MQHEQAVGRLGRNNRLSLVGSIISAALGFVVLLVATNGLGDTDSGVLLVAVAVFNIAMLSSVVGTDAGLVRFLAQARAGGRPEHIGMLVRGALLAVLGVSVAVAAAIALFADPIGALFVPEGPPDSAIAKSLRVVAIVLPAGSLSVAMLAATRGFGQMRTTVVFDRIARPVTQLLAVAGAVVAGAGPVIVTAAWVGPVVVSAVAAAWWLRREIPVAGRAQVGSDRPAPVGEFWSFTWPQMGTGVLRVSIRWLDTLVVGALLGVGPAAVYTAATRLLKLGSFFNQATFQAAAPQIAEDLGVGEVARATSVYRSASTWLLVATWPLYLSTLLYAPEIVQVFGEDFSGGANALRILSGAMLVASACGPVEAVLVMSGRTRLNLINNGVALALNVGLGLLLIPPFGLEGAAFAWAISVLCTNLAPLTQIHSSLGMHPFSRVLIVTAVVLVLAFVAIAAGVGVLDLGSVGTAVAGVGSSGLVTSVFMWLWREPLALDRLVGAKRSTKAVPVPTEDLESTI